jgi:hypothetical protein
MFEKLGTVVRTLRHLTLKQLIYQLKYRLKIPSLYYNRLVLKKSTADFNSFDFLKTPIKFQKHPYQFTFLNRCVTFESEIDWNYVSEGKLWNYNLNYLDFISNESLNSEEIKTIIESFYNNYNLLEDAIEPYPTSLRIMNLIKVINHHRFDKIEIILKNDIVRLFHSLEYHLLGNHLLENAFALYFAAHLFPTEERLVNKAVNLLKEQLEEQILEDGGHYERSFMYHQIVLGRLLESISLSEANPRVWNVNVLYLLKEKARHMISWMLTISDNGRIFQRFNDSVEGISPTTSELIRLSYKLSLVPTKLIKLSDSGFRVLKNNNLLITANVGSITPSYQPGHSHADSLSFTLHLEDKPIIVDPGISTYENNKQRKLERGTSYHNTVCIQKRNNNEVWSAFRVGRRARINLIEDSFQKIEAEHDGYQYISSIHRRSWKMGNSEILISDIIISPKKFSGTFSLHLHPDVDIMSTSSKSVKLNNDIQISFNTDSVLQICDYYYSDGFNKIRRSKKIDVNFYKTLTTEISYENPFHN